MTTNYTLRRSANFNFFLGACAVGLIAIPVSYAIKPILVLAALVLLASYVFGAYQMYIQQEYVALEGGTLMIIRKHKARVIASYNLERVDKVLFDDFWGCYRIGIKRDREVITHELSLVGKKEAAQMMRDLQTMGMPIISRK